MMESLILTLKYLFVVSLGVEVVLILRALFNLARDKAHAAQLPAATED